MIRAAVQQYVAQPIEVLRSKTAMHAGLVMGGNLISGMLRFTVFIVLAKALSVNELGYLVVFVTLMDLVAVFCDSGLNPTMVRFMALHEGERVEPLILRCLQLKVAISTVLVIVLSIGYPLFVRFQRIPEDYRWLYPVAIGAAVFLSLNTFGMAILQGRKRFGLYAVLSVAINSVRFAVIGTLAWWSIGRAVAYYGSFFAAPPLAVLFAVVLVTLTLRRDAKLGHADVSYRKLIRFVIPLAAMSAATMLFRVADVFMLKALTSGEVVANYGLAYQVAFVFPLLTMAMFTVLLPKVAAMTTADELRRYHRRVLSVYPIVLVAAVAAMFLLPPALSLVFGDKYTSAVPVLRILVMAFGLNLILNPLSLILYALDRPQYFTLIQVFKLVLLVPLDLLLIPRFEGIGAAAAIAVLKLIGVLLMIVCTARTIKAKERQESHEVQTPVD